MKDQRTAPPSLNQPLPHSHEPLLDTIIDESKTHVEQGICVREREALIDISFKMSIIPSSRPLVLE